MIKFIKIATIVYFALLIQVTILPAYIADPFKPNLLIVVIAYLGLRDGGWPGALMAFFLGLTEDCVSGLYLGLSGFTFLSIHLLIRRIAARLYADSLYIIVFVVFFATIFNGLAHMILLFIFSAAEGIYATIIAGLVPQALVNALAASLLFSVPSFKAREEAR